MLWDSYILQLRFQNQSVARRTLTEKQRRGGLLGTWRRFHRDAAIEAYMPTVRKIAREQARNFAQHLDIRDLIQCGMVGLVEAAERYHPDNGAFEPFAYFRVRGAIIDAHKRRAYREETHDSLQAIAEANDGWLPAALDADRTVRPLDEVLIEQQDIANVRHAISQLLGTSRQVLEAMLDGLSIVQISMQMDRSEGWVREQIRIAKVALKHALGGTR
jgi:RNA polymerase sigma factor (sigma-70 family)